MTQFNIAVTLKYTMSWSVNIMIVRFKVLTLLAVKVIDFWDVMLCSVVFACVCVCVKVMLKVMNILQL